MLSWLLRYVVGKVASIPVRRKLNAFDRATHEPRRVQETKLREILRRHQATDFGRRHHFHDIRTLADFRRHLPVASYEYFEPTEVSGYPAVYASLLDSRDSGICDLWIGVNDHEVVHIMTNLASEKNADASCGLAADAADAVITTLGS